MPRRPRLGRSERVGDAAVEGGLRVRTARELLCDGTVAQEEDTARTAGRADGVRDHDDGLPRAVDRAEETEQLLGGAGVERTGRLVGKEHLRARDERAGHGGALLLAAGDLVGVFFEKAGNAEPVGERDKAGLHLAAALALQDEGEENVVLQREGVEKAEVLKDEAEVVTAEGRRALLGDLGEVLPAEEDRAAGGAVERREEVQKRGFAAAALAHDGDVLAALDGEGDAFERLDLRAAEAGGVGLGETADFKKGHGENSFPIFLSP